MVTPADFGLIVTVGIAAVTIPDAHFVTVSDRMVSFDDLVQAPDNATMKTYALSDQWGLLFAGDIGPVIPIRRRILERIAKENLTQDLATMKWLIRDVYMEFYEETVIAHCLTKFGIKSLSEFLENGLKEFGDRYFRKLCSDIEKTAFSLQLLVYGYGENGDPHLFSISEPRSVVDHDLLGYAVIGSGYWMALATLTSRPMNDRGLDTIIYRLLEAKFCAETAGGVGIATSVVTRNREGRIGQMTTGQINEIRKIWTAKISEPPPDEATKIIEQSGAVKGIKRDF